MRREVFLKKGQKIRETRRNSILEIALLKSIHSNLMSYRMPKMKGKAESKSLTIYVFILTTFLFLFTFGPAAAAQGQGGPPKDQGVGFTVSPIPIIRPVTEEGAGLALVYRY